jgi:hypothetical protein
MVHGREVLKKLLPNFMAEEDVRHGFIFPFRIGGCSKTAID